MQLKKSICFALMLISAFLFQGCVKDSIEYSHQYTVMVPVYATTQEVRNNIKYTASQDVERPGKIYIKDNFIFLNEIDKGVHVIDNTNPASPQNAGFIPIPGNMDLAIKGNTLYADMYTDLVAIDISNPKQARLKKVVENIFPNRHYPYYFGKDSSKIIVKWEQRDTVVYGENTIMRGEFLLLSDVANYSSNFSSSTKASAASPYGMGGSMARFTLAKERLFTLGNGTLDVFNVENSNDPFFVSRQNLGWEIETIFPFKDKLFIGTRVGMQMFDIDNPNNPRKIGAVGHLRSCDPVVANDQFAFVTIWGGTRCGGGSNELQIVNLMNFMTPPTVVKTYSMKSPKGLSLDDNLLFICDEGLKVYDVSNVNNILLKDHEEVEGSYDVIAFDHIALVVGQKGIYQYDYSNPVNLKLLSTLQIKN